MPIAKDYTEDLFGGIDSFRCHYPASPLVKHHKTGGHEPTGLSIGCRYPLFAKVSSVGHVIDTGVSQVDGLFQCTSCGTLYYRDSDNIIYIYLSDKWRLLDDIKKIVVMDIDNTNIDTSGDMVLQEIREEPIDLSRFNI